MPNETIITLTTDFGEDGPYAAAIKGVILAINPAARLIDLSHQIPPQDLRHAAFFLASALPYFPEEALHVVVVDPGVGSDRSLLYVECAGRRLLVPDNGSWTWLGEPTRVIQLADQSHWRQPCSATFHGRDILAPVAAKLSLGLDPLSLGPIAGQWVKLPRPEPRCDASSISGEVVFVDRFGNLITNIAEAMMASLTQSREVVIGERKVNRFVRSYAEGLGDEPVALISSQGTLEITLSNGNASRLLGMGIGAPVTVRAAELPVAPEPPAQDASQPPIDTGIALFAPIELPPVPARLPEAAADEALSIGSDAPSFSLPPRPIPRGMRGGYFIALVFVPLVSYALLATLAVFILYTRPAAPDPLERLPDIEGDLKGSRRQKQDAVSYERVSPESPLPANLRVAVGRTLRVGDVDIRPQQIALRRLVFRQARFDPEPAAENSLVLTILFRNASADAVFSPTDPYFDRRWRSSGTSGRPYSFLDIGAKRVFGGALDWQAGRSAERRESIDGQNYKLLAPGEELTSLVCTDPDAKVEQLLSGYNGPLLWRVQVRRGLVPVRGRDVSASAVVGVTFSTADIKHGA
jgi:S-adenosylmethionine hydrolase